MAAAAVARVLQMCEKTCRWLLCNAVLGMDARQARATYGLLRATGARRLVLTRSR